jgi:hypothetical protein
MPNERFAYMNMRDYKLRFILINNKKNINRYFRNKIPYVNINSD